MKTLIKRLLGYLGFMYCTTCGGKMIEVGYRGWVKCPKCKGAYYPHDVF